MWVGAPADERKSSEAMRFLNSIPDHIPSYITDDQKAQLVGATHDAAGYISFAAGDSALCGLLDLASATYWRRLWVIQEAHLASEAHIQFGSHYTCWERLKSFCKYLRYKLSPDTDEGANMSAVAQSPMAGFMVADSGSVSCNLSALCWIHASAECDKILDKVFGLWALAQRCCREAVPVDYELKFEELMDRLLLHDIAAHGEVEGNYESVEEFVRQNFGTSNILPL